MLDKHGRFVAWGKNIIGLQKGMASLVEVYASLHIKDRSNLTGDDQQKIAVRAYLAASKVEG